MDRACKTFGRGNPLRAYSWRRLPSIFRAEYLIFNNKSIKLLYIKEIFPISDKLTMVEFA